MHNLDRRLSELERRTTKQLYNIVVHFIANADDELWFLTDRNGKEWTRNADESDSDFRQRAFSGATRSDFGVASLFCSN